MEKVLDSKKYYGYVQYLVKWARYNVSEATWEPVQNVKHCKKLLNKFHATHSNAVQPVLLTNLCPVQKEFNHHVWLKHFTGGQILKRG